MAAINETISRVQVPVSAKKDTSKVPSQPLVSDPESSCGFKVDYDLDLTIKEKKSTEKQPSKRGTDSGCVSTDSGCYGTQQGCVSTDSGCYSTQSGC